MGRPRKGWGPGRNGSFDHEDDQQLLLWEKELDRRVEAVNKFVLDSPENNEVFPKISDNTEITVAQRTMFENFSVNEFALRNILLPVLQQAGEDIAGFRGLDVRDRLSNKGMVSPFKYGVRTLVELIDSLDKLLKRRDDYAALLPDLKQKATIESQIISYAQEVQAGKVVSFHRPSLPNTVYKSVTPERQHQFRSSEDSTKLKQQMAALEMKENSIEPKSVGQVLF